MNRFLNAAKKGLSSLLKGSAAAATIGLTVASNTAASHEEQVALIGASAATAALHALISAIRRFATFTANKAS